MGADSDRRDYACRRTGTCRLPARSATENNVLFIADEIQSGMGVRQDRRSQSKVVLDIYIMGKALGGGIYPSPQLRPMLTSLVCSSRASMDRRSAATRSRRPSAVESSRCSRPVSSRSVRAPWATTCSGACVPRHPNPSPRFAAVACGRGSPLVRAGVGPFPL